MRSAGLLLVALLLAGPLTGPLAAQDAAVPEGQATAVAREAIDQLRSPYCPGLMLEVCPSPQAEALRDSIRVLAAQGRSADQIVEWMVAGHGEEWRAVPRRRGFGWLAWLIPPLVLAAGGVVVFRRLSGGVDRAPVPVAEELSEGDRARLAAALSEWERSEEEEGNQ